MLRQELYHIVEARRGRDALSVIEQRKIDLVILDLMIPGMGGLEFCRYLKADRRTQLIPLIVPSGGRIEMKGFPQSPPPETVENWGCVAIILTLLLPRIICDT
jgi:hypothetical protein